MNQHDNISSTGVYTVPTSHTLLTYSPHVYISNAQQGNIKFSYREYEQAGFITDFEVGANAILGSAKLFANRYSEKTDLQSWTSNISSGANVSITQEAVLLKNSCWQ